MPVKDHGTIDDIETRFTYHQPDSKAIERITRVRDAAKEFAYIIAQNVPICADQFMSFTHLDEAVFHANAGIARDGKV